MNQIHVKIGEKLQKKLNAAVKHDIGIANMLSLKSC